MWLWGPAPHVYGTNMGKQTCHLIEVVTNSGPGDPYVGRYLYALERSDGAVKIRHRRAELDLEAPSWYGAAGMIFEGEKGGSYAAHRGE